MVTQERYENNLKRVGAWNDSIIVISKGWFNDTCRQSPVKRISFLRLDGDIFVSTWDALTTLYDRVVPGGYVYVDDYGSFNGCRYVRTYFICILSYIVIYCLLYVIILDS